MENDKVYFYINQLDSLMKINKYEDALSYVKLLKYEKSLTPEVLLNCINCFEELEQYRECINFCDFRLEFFPEDDYLLFYSSRGECYYFLDEHEKALEYMSIYFEEADRNNSQPNVYYRGLYANILFETFHFKSAEIIYKEFFDEILKEENLSMETIFTSQHRKSHGYKLYNYAYCCFFQGKENEGYKYLLLSKKCGNKDAEDDCKKLDQCSTFAKDVKYKTKTLKEFDNYIKQLDIKIKDYEGDASSFWNHVQLNSKQYQEFCTVSKRDNIPGTLKRALSQMNHQKLILDKELNECNPYKVGPMETFLNSFLCGDESFLKDLRVYPAKEPNAFATPYGDLYLTDGLINLYHFNKAMLLGVCAHEATHFICKHLLVGLWKQEKKEKKNELLAGIAAGVNVAGHGVAAISYGVSYDQDYWDSVEKSAYNLIQSFRKDTYYFQFKYGRSQELESDLIAYRFCEYMGIGGYAYIMALQLLGDENGTMVSAKDSDHPTNAYRIGLLKYLYAQEHPNNN